VDFLEMKTRFIGFLDDPDMVRKMRSLKSSCG
jgi:hypothetical protein